MKLLENSCGLQQCAALENSQDITKLNARIPSDAIHGRRGPTPTSQPYDSRSSNQDATSVSDGESVGPIDSPETIEPEVADLVCAAVQEMESLARNCILVEESYQRYFMRNCGTQKEEAVWRQHGIREEAMSRQAAKAISQIHISELWARVGYYNNEAAQRSNLFRLLLQEKRKLECDGQLSDPRNRGSLKGINGTVRQVERRRKRPNQSPLDCMVHGAQLCDMLRMAAKSTKPDDSSQPSSAPSHPCRTALVHNPYSFDGPSQVTVGLSQGDEPPASHATPPPVPSPPSGPIIGAMGAVLKRVVPEHWHQVHDGNKTVLSFNSAPLLLNVMQRGLPAKESAVSSVSFAKSVRAAEHSALDQKVPEGAEETSMNGNVGLVESCHEMKRRTSIGSMDLWYDGLPSTADKCAYPEACPSTEPLAQALAVTAEQMTEQAFVLKDMAGGEHRPKKKGTRTEDENGEDHATLLTYPTCNHAKYWKRLRANRGFAYFVCYACGAKWRMISKGGRTPNAAPNGGRHDIEATSTSRADSQIQLN